MALGATRAGIVKLILRGAMTLAAVGVGIGLVATPLAFRFLRAAVYGVEPWSPPLLASVAALISIVCAVASALPAWRAARTTNPRYLYAPEPGIRRLAIRRSARSMYSGTFRSAEGRSS